jgi:hypothetical protein
MSTLYAIQRDITGTNNSLGAGIPCALNGEVAALAANTEQHFTVPSNYPNWMVVIAISYGSTVYFDGIGTAAVPSGSFAASTTEIVPITGLIRYVKAGQVLSFITADSGGAHITIKLYTANLYTNAI